VNGRNSFLLRIEGAVFGLRKMFLLFIVLPFSVVRGGDVDYPLYPNNRVHERVDTAPFPLVLDSGVTLPCTLPKNKDLIAPLLAGTISASHDPYLAHFNAGTYGHVTLRKSQAHEDTYIYEKYFFAMRTGLIIESGALDGVKFSNSFLFDKLANWTAIHIEPDPSSYASLTQNRGGSVNVNAALCNASSVLHFVNRGNHASRGIVEYMVVRFLCVSFLFQSQVTNPTP